MSSDRFMVFGGQTYYGAGGMNDYIGSSPNVQEAEFLGKTFRDDNNNLCEWWQVVDTANNMEVVSTSGNCYGGHTFRNQLNDQIRTRRLDSAVLGP